MNLETRQIERSHKGTSGARKKLEQYVRRADFTMIADLAGRYPEETLFHALVDGRIKLSEEQLASLYFLFRITRISMHYTLPGGRSLSEGEAAVLLNAGLYHDWLGTWSGRRVAARG
jgi:hypothetical protein